MDVVFTKLYESHGYLSRGLQAILNLRLVCKGWRDACSDFTGIACIECKEHTHLLKACRTLPALCSLNIENSGADTCFSVLSRMTSLRELSIGQSPLDEEPVLDPWHLPSSLKELAIEYLAVHSPSDNISFTGLTYLRCNSLNCSAEGVLNLIQQLPALQVSYWQ